MAELLDRLIRDHKHLLRVLDLLDDLLDRFHAGGEPDYELLCELLEYMEDYADQVHHPSEEDIFDRLRARSNEKYPVLDLLSNQHQLLSQVNKRFCRSLEGIMHEEVLRRDQVEVQGRELVKTLREHLDLEERAAFPLARERLSASDWDELRSTASGEQDPLFGEAGQRRFQSLLRYLAD
ncbi:hemerythrin domain-containing protein [Candidatus Thiosymbion oneisti]|uniref:hemerythrin domain-containing protein n=1 Tax=Candidatus Thiosymbion oneisti TaxID=589554 RepID=UPI000B7FE358|nr:hemerythrin domain-containing protein [Candidatus Thiosymbion oneisti]